MAEEVKDQKTQEKESVDEKGVPWLNRVKELERKWGDKFTALERENQELKAAIQPEEKPNEDDLSKAELMEFVKSPKNYVRNAWQEAEFQRQIPEAERWIKSQQGYSAEDDTEIYRIIKERKLDTPYHSPMDRAQIAWDLLDRERLRKKSAQKDDEQLREERAKNAATEGGGKAVPKEKQVTRNDLLRKLADAETKGDIDASIKLISLLEDIR